MALCTDCDLLTETLSETLAEFELYKRNADRERDSMGIQANSQQQRGDLMEREIFKLNGIIHAMNCQLDDQKKIMDAQEKEIYRLKGMIDDRNGQLEDMEATLKTTLKFVLGD